MNKPQSQEDTPMEQLTQRDFRELSLDRIEARTGLEAPENPSPDEEATYREKAWNSYRLDIENRDEWGTATESTPAPQGEEPEL